MSNKLLSMFELVKKGFPVNDFYALDFEGVSENEIIGFLQDGLRNFHARVKTRSMCVRTGLSGFPEAKLFLAGNIDANNDELILSVMHKAVAFIKEKYALNNAFIILQKWTSEEDYVYSVNIMPLGNEYIVEAVKGNHALMERKNIPPCIMKLSPNGVNILKEGLAAHELLELNRLTNRFINSYILEQNCVYEFSFIKEGMTFYQIKKPGELVRNPLSKKEFYSKLNERKINYENKILRKGNYYAPDITRDVVGEFMNEDSKRDY